MPSPSHPSPGSAAIDGQRGWLSLGPASRLLGVDPDTLRRWADEGRVEVFATPGGHRRFQRRSLERLLANRRPRHRPLTSLGATPERVSRAYRRSYDTPGSGARVVGGDAAEREVYRDHGRRLVEALLGHLDADPADAAARSRAETEAGVLVDDLAVRLAEGGTSLTESVGLFVAARRPFLAEIAALGRRRALDPARLATLYEDASGLLDRLLLRLVAAHQAGSRT